MHHGPSAPRGPEYRQHRRTPLPAAYTQFRLRRSGESEYFSEGHAYDLSEGGVRFEIDAPLPPGEIVDVELIVPGSIGAAVHATGRIARLHDPDELGPTRMAICFTSVQEPQRLARLVHDLESIHMGFDPPAATRGAA